MMQCSWCILEYPATKPLAQNPSIPGSSCPCFFLANVSLLPPYLSPCVANRNGVGKSTLLHVLGSRLLVGFPAWLSCLHVEQEVQASSSTTAVEAVLAADVKAQQLQR